MGRATRDDAAVWRRPDGRALVATVDVFTPIVDDAATWGRIAAANAVGDVYAMGGTPLFALAVAAWPREQLPLELLTEVLRGGEEIAATGGWVVAGGHTIDGPEPLYGQVVIGEVDEDRILTNSGARPGDVIVLTKALGTGLVATAVKRRDPAAVAPDGDLRDVYTAAVSSMTRLNDRAAELGAAAGATAATDVTGFGFLGHLLELCAGSGVAADIEVAAVPQLPGLEELLAAGEVPGGTRRNLEHVRSALRAGSSVSEDLLTVLADAQTSGGLLLCLPSAAAAADLVEQLRGEGHAAAVVGRVTEPGGAAAPTIVLHG